VTSARVQVDRRLPSLTGLRAIAALCVFLSHSAYILVHHSPRLHEHYAFWVMKIGNLALSFFFILSGFVLTWSFRPGRSVAQFWRSRFFKIFPTHVAVFLLALGLLIAAGESIRVPEALANLFLVHAWTATTDFFIWPVNGVTWSLSVELGFYACFPLLHPMVTRLPAARLWPALITVIGAILLLPVAATTFLPDHPQSPFTADPLSWSQYWVIFFFPLSRALEFLAGMLLARLVLSGRWPRIGIPTALLIAAVLYPAAVYLPAAYSLSTAYPISAILILGAAVNSDLAGHRTPLNHPTTVWFGKLSFAFYVVHLVVLFNLHAAFAGQLAGYHGYQPPDWSTWQAVWYLIGALPLITLIAAGLHHWVEAPISRRWSQPRRSAPAGPETTVSEPAVPGHQR
jgi:peptidoglycan/LPS O-acetylase OafA/YrhL